MKLTDPWFRAMFIGEMTAHGSFRFEHEDGRPIAFSEAQGVMLWCPCGYGKPEFPIDGGRPHAVIVPFSNGPGGACPPDFGPTNDAGQHPRWTVSGSDLSNLSTTPSVLVGSPAKGTECWHGYITNGELR